MRIFFKRVYHAFIFIINKIFNDSELIALTKAVQESPYIAQNYIRRAGYYSQHGHSSHALKDYDTAIFLNPQIVEAYYKRAQIVYESNPEAAINDLNIAIQMQPKYAKAYDLRGQFLFRNEQYEKAIIDFSKAINLNPDEYGTAYCYLYRGRAKIKLNENKSALYDINKAISLGLKVNALRGEIYFYLKDFDNAIVELTKALEYSPKNKNYNILVANAFREIGDMEKALIYYKKAVRCKSTNGIF